MNISPKRKRSPLARVALWSILAFAVLLVIGFIALRIWITAYLQSPAFRELIGGITAKQLKATGDYLPFKFAGTTIYSDAFKAKGTPQASFSELGADQIRADINLNGLWNHAWQIDEISIQRLQISLGHGGMPAGDAGEEPESQPPPAPQWSWLPNRVDLRKVAVQEANLKWGEGTAQPGSVQNMALTITPDGEAWNIVCDGGDISQKGTPALTIDRAHLRYQRPTLFITDAQLKYSTDGSIGASGEVNFGKDYEVITTLNKIPITPFLREDWRAKLRGNLLGDVKIRGTLPFAGTPDLSGSLSLAQGELEALPVLDQIATFTSTERFRKLSLTRTSADFRYSGGKLTVTKFISESEGLIRVEGGFVIENGNIDGNFQVGITPSSLQWLPSALQTRVFSVAHDGYVWTAMHITGPMNNPSEDLTPRLEAAAVNGTIDTVKDTAKGLIEKVPGSDLIPDKIPDAPKQIINDVLSPLFGK